MEMALEDGDGAVVVLEDGGGVAALGAGIKWWLKIAVAAWVAAAAEEHVTMALVSVSLKPRAHY